MGPGVVLSAAVSLDWRIADKTGHVGWLAPRPASDFGFDAFLAELGCIVMGRTTFELGKRPWPYGAMRCVVMSHRQSETELSFLSREEGPLTPLIERLRGDMRGALLIMGGGQVFSQALTEGVVDRIDLAVLPTILGCGPLLLPEGTRPPGFAANEVRLAANGGAWFVLRREVAF
jgi:dihydrofolate reductase